MTLVSPFVGMLIVMGGLQIVTKVPFIYLATVAIVILITYTIVCMTCTEKVIVMVTKVVFGVVTISMVVIMIQVAVFIIQMIFTGK